jgi:hypothetical protein
MTNNVLLRSALHDSRPWDRLLARTLAPSLDQQIATGCLPGSSRALAIRARQIVSPAARRELARGWQHALDQVRQPPVPRTPRGLLRRDRIAAAEHDVREMLAVLTSEQPIAARGAAMASGLLTDGTGPLYSRHSLLDLGAAVREATRQMSPLAAAPAAGADRVREERYQ